MSHPHLSDDRLIEICFDLDVTAADRTHLQGCDACQSRRSNLADTLDDVGTVMTQEADAAFPADRLSARAHRAACRSGWTPGSRDRVSSRPHSRICSAPHPPGALGHGCRRRRLVPGGTPGRTSRSRHTRQPPVDGRASAGQRRRAHKPAPTCPTTNCSARSSSRPVALDRPLLRPLDALTPRAWDVR